MDGSKLRVKKLKNLGFSRFRGELVGDRKEDARSLLDAPSNVDTSNNTVSGFYSLQNFLSHLSDKVQ